VLVVACDCRPKPPKMPWRARLGRDELDHRQRAAKRRLPADSARVATVLGYKTGGMQMVRFWASRGPGAGSTRARYAGA
jgi:hypothetical protein